MNGKLLRKTERNSETQKLKLSLTHKPQSTIDYYNQNAKSFFSDTIDFDMTAIYEPFLKLLPDNAHPF
jgi:hypothetical protein